MAKKKAAISELIKSDMSRRAIGEEPRTVEPEAAEPNAVEEVKPSPPAPEAAGEVKPASTTPEAAEEVKQPPAEPEKQPPEKKAPALKPTAVSNESAGFEAFIAGQAQAVGLTDEADLRNFYEHLKVQAMRYLRGFDAGRRFHG